MALHWFKCRAEAVVFYLVITAGYPHFTLIFQAYLGGADDVACWMKGYIHAIDIAYLTKVDTFIMIITQAQLHYRDGVMMGEIVLMAVARVVAVGMGDQGILYRPPGVDIKISLPAVKAFIGKFYKLQTLSFLVLTKLLKDSFFWSG